MSQENLLQGGLSWDWHPYNDQAQGGSNHSIQQDAMPQDLSLQGGLPWNQHENGDQTEKSPYLLGNFAFELVNILPEIDDKDIDPVYR